MSVGTTRVWCDVTSTRTAKAHGLALARVADLASDPVLRERLAVTLEERAAKTWSDVASAL